MFCSTAVTILSGAVAERMRFGGYIVSTVLIAGLIYPVFGHWVWNGTLNNDLTGWLRTRGFVDFAGSTVVHSIGGWFALAAVLIVGPRRGRFFKGAPPKMIPGANLPMAVMGVMLLWFGWIGFNGGSLLAFSDRAPGIIINTIIAGAAGLITILLSVGLLRKSADASLLMNGTLAGLVSITAGCHAVDARSAFLIGSCGALVMWGASNLLERLRIDDAVGAVGVHLGGGIWGTLAVALFAEENGLAIGLSRPQQLQVQILGIVVCFLWAFPLSWLLLWIVNYFTPLRVTPEAELVGLNVSEHGATSAFHETFSIMDQQATTGDLSLRAPVEPFTEAGLFSRHYNRVMDHLQEALVRNEHLMASKEDLQRATEQLREQEAGLKIEIGARKQAELQLRRTRNLLSDVVNSMPSVLVGVDGTGKVTQWNSEARRTTGMAPEDAMGRSLAQAFPHLADLMTKVREAIQVREVRSDAREVRDEAGEIRHEEVTIYPLISGDAAGAVVRVDDVTERVRIEEMIVQSERMHSVGELAAGMAHEINNPLGGMMQTASVMNDRLTNLELQANQRAAEDAGVSMEAVRDFMQARGIIKMLGRIRESGSRAAKIVNNMLSFARKSDSSLKSCNLVELLDQSLDLAGSDYDLKKTYDFRQIEIVRDYEKDLPHIPCESGEIRQVLLNILRNGAEAMHEGAEKGEGKKPRFILRLAEEREAGMVRVEIEDNGPGMQESTRKRLFEPFFTTKPIGRGTGLGLSVSYFIITENHGGKISVESQSGGGAIFVIRLPIKGKESWATAR